MSTSRTAVHQNASTNRLAGEKSPYLLQHQHNPVAWHPWGEEAFARARTENKPIFLSIGYSTCHWCHVMERESFENEEIARILNAHFISIKVDREERPDVDKIYMTFVQATTGHGGWPLSAFLTPDLKPFFGGTYFPPENRHGSPGFGTLLNEIAQLWDTRRADLADSARTMHARLTEATAQASQPAGQGELSSALLGHAAAVFKASHDPRHGGFGSAPKFPQPSFPRFLLRYAHRFQDADATRMVLHTCQRMAAGGIHDQLGGGFSRYSVDAEWLVPHFEKMLYDNAQLLQLYLDAHLVSRDPQYTTVARDILEYVLRDMTHPQGGFYSAEDADSEGHEGKFYSWTLSELKDLLSSEEYRVAVRHFGLTPGGNFVDHSHPAPLQNQNVLSIVDTKLSPAEVDALASAKAKMFRARAERVRPHLDDKILSSWNGLMLGALARASAILADDLFHTAARKNLTFIQEHLWDASTNTLYHRWRDGERDNVQLLEAYAFLLSGVLDLYETTLAARDLEFAMTLAEAMHQKFFDPENGGFWQSAADDLILKVKEDYDGAEPSGNSVAIFSLLRLSRITGRKDFEDSAHKSLRLFSNRLRELPQAVPYMLQALDFFTSEPLQVVIAGDPEAISTRALVQAAHSSYHPNRIILGTSGPVHSFGSTLPTGRSGESLAYVCTGSSCQAPVSLPEQLNNVMASA
jgi:uncharacterized protein